MGDDDSLLRNPDWRGLTKGTQSEDTKDWIQNGEIICPENDIIERLSIIESKISEISDKLEVRQLIMPFSIAGLGYKLDVLVEKENDTYVASLFALDIASQGDSVIDACENLKEAIELYFEGETEEFIKKKTIHLKSV